MANALATLENKVANCVLWTHKHKITVMYEIVKSLKSDDFIFDDLDVEGWQEVPHLSQIRNEYLSATVAHHLREGDKVFWWSQSAINQHRKWLVVKYRDTCEYAVVICDVD